MNGGYYDEARAWRDWLLRAAAGSPDQLQIMYGVTGKRWLAEREVPWLDGYENSKPVRVGNAAADQRQLDVYGEVMDALHHARVGRSPVRGASAAVADGGSSTSKTRAGRPSSVANFSIGPARAAGEHWVQTPPLGLHGHKMARIAVGAVNHPRAAVRHSRRTGRLREAAFLAAKGDLVHQAVKRRLEPCRGAVRVSVAERPARIMTQAGRVGT
jgi:hypothetical protein